MKKILLLSVAILFIVNAKSQNGNLTYYTSSNSNTATLSNTQTLIIPYGNNVVIGNIPNYFYQGGNPMNVEVCSPVPPSSNSCQYIGYFNTNDPTYQFVSITYSFSVDNLTRYSMMGAEGGSIIFYIKTTGGVGIRENTMNKINFSIYPNPASEILNVELEMVNGTAEVKILDVLGNIIKSEKLKIKNAKAEINVNELLKGIYFVQIGNAVKKFIKE